MGEPLWNAPLYAVPQKWDERGKVIEVRPCLDLRGLTATLVNYDKHPIPEIRTILQKCRDVYWVSEIDLKKAFFNILVDERDQLKLAFRNQGNREARMKHSLIFQELTQS
jgi:hypothetical protein